jgi:hypothetical protein
MELEPTLSLDPVGPGASLLRGGPGCASQVFAHLAGATLPLRLATASGRGGPRSFGYTARRAPEGAHP